MGRLTYEKEDGAWGLTSYDIKKAPKELYGAICKLHEYEKSGLTPEQLLEVDRLYTDRCKEISELKKQIRKERKQEEMPGWKGHFVDRFLKVE